MKAIAAVLLSFLITPSTVLAQDSTAGTREGEIVQASARSSGSLRQSIAREGAKLAEYPVSNSLQHQQEPQRTWAGRHPVGLGAMIGAAGGVIWGAAVCSSSCNGSDGQTTQLWMGIGAGVGAAIGAGIGAIVSLARR
jgi:hypothetical protein